MVEQITRFKNEITGQGFNTLEEAQESEDRSRDIQEAFAFYQCVEDKGCIFGNGDWAIQRDETFYRRLQDTLIEMIKKHEPHALKNWTPSRKNLDAYFIGRYLSDSGSELRKWESIHSHICPHCFREFGQGYFKLHCTHSMKAYSIGVALAMEAKKDE